MATGGDVTLRVLADREIPGVESLLGRQAEVRRFDGPVPDREELAHSDALLVRSITRVDRALLAASAVRFVGSATSGVDHVDRAYLAAADIGFSHAPGANANAVVDYVLAAIAAVDDYLERLMAGGRVGIVGYGHVGSRLAQRLAALGAKPLVSDPWLPRAALPRSAQLATLLACEVLSLHCSLTLEPPWPSRHLLGETALSRMGPTSLLINASRGAVVDNVALRTALAGGAGPCCVLDVWEGEPAIDPGLLRRVRLGTAHIAGYSRDGKWRATEQVCQALRRHFALTAGTAPRHCDPAAVLHVPAGTTGAALVRHLIAARYDIRQDDRALRDALLRHGDGAAPAAFERLRRHYGERRELAGSPVHGAALSPPDRRLVRALGCVLTDGR